MELHRILMFLGAAVSFIAMLFSTSFTTSSEPINLQQQNLTASNGSITEANDANLVGYASTETPTLTSSGSIKAYIANYCLFSPHKTMDKDDFMLLKEMLSILNPAVDQNNQPVLQNQHQCISDKLLLREIYFGSKQLTTAYVSSNKMNSYKELMRIFREFVKINGKINDCIHPPSHSSRGIFDAKQDLYIYRGRHMRTFIKAFNKIHWTEFSKNARDEIISLIQRSISLLTPLIRQCFKENLFNYETCNSKYYFDSLAPEVSFCEVLEQFQNDGTWQCPKIPSYKRKLRN